MLLVLQDPAVAKCRSTQSPVAILFVRKGGDLLCGYIHRGPMQVSHSFLFVSLMNNRYGMYNGEYEVRNY